MLRLKCPKYYYYLFFDKWADKLPDGLVTTTTLIASYFPYLNWKYALLMKVGRPHQFKNTAGDNLLDIMRMQYQSDRMDIDANLIVLNIAKSW